MKKGILKTLCGLMAALMLLVFAGTPVTTQAAKLPYYIKINRQQNCVTVYALDSKGKYTKPVKAFACSVGVNNATPTGTFSIPAKYRWHTLMGGVYGQYCSRIHGGDMQVVVSRESLPVVHPYCDAIAGFGEQSCYLIRVCIRHVDALFPVGFVVGWSLCPCHQIAKILLGGFFVGSLLPRQLDAVGIDFVYPYYLVRNVGSRVGSRVGQGGCLCEGIEVLCTLRISHIYENIVRSVGPEPSNGVGGDIDLPFTHLPDVVVPHVRCLTPGNNVRQLVL